MRRPGEAPGRTVPFCANVVEPLIVSVPPPASTPAGALVNDAPATVSTLAAAMLAVPELEWADVARLSVRFCSTSNVPWLSSASSIWRPPPGPASTRCVPVGPFV